ncbi:DUF421 domain-containing protein [Ectobacillus antri]|uniref:DUF421 domain-containing protein n=2 Tax=Ectobacillus antri TaxID=2486280 RepID=A0ABT6H802_9BACI|nr:DUF421 domain-containing protein [Ectobacillus antri]MDG4658461.1 DUF421 domain-containing protein [Ectobacillus antri]MDG5755460.1 DUF421 domain-containing protein [Ectobacillus antri]
MLIKGGVPLYKDMTIELIGGFLALLIMLKILGKIQFAQITPFDFITALVLGNIVGDAVFEKNVGLREIVYSILVWGLLIYIIEFVTLKSYPLRKLLEGKPTLLINKGEIVYKELKKNKLDLNQLQHLLRLQGFFSIYEAEYVILEVDGKISVAPKHEYSPATKQDLHLKHQDVFLPIALIMDGALIPNNLEESGHSEAWLKQQLAKKGVKQYKDVMYAEWERNKGLRLTKF